MTTPTKTSFRRVLPLFIAATAAVGLAACGGDDDDAPKDSVAETATTVAAGGGATTTVAGGAATTVAAAVSDMSIPEIGSKDDAIDFLVGLGLTEEQAECVADKAEAEGLDTAKPDVSKMTGIFEECDVDLASLGG